ncbi:acetyl-CoA carboxylase carboxyltransferase subunit alpha [Spirochaeta africana]|uniref:Acetyl-coenzyme A carboxylase carboxyl transferase subunit alpha n=1 Tax=Spirochaeta africana (strain ATCC 700263 / DSM 8902 / Z-7692) TaxID=889378 RepID=H9UL54_SPIAZ|nr:acetyl-CoA carboxylase carboxyltransferase subunit alpha [Spirochaeta africana]AFG38247.1 acetyl-CoA carboxylase, carboxyl transferase, alpha subunit [Spirochaeta africana DSM 8902]
MNDRELHRKLAELKEIAARENIDIRADLSKITDKISGRGEEAEVLDAWKRVTLARHPNRPTALHYIKQMSENYIELHGDRAFGDDPALVGGICTIGGQSFTFLGHQKGANMKENLYRNYGMAHPEGYRKALRLAKQAERFNRPILTLIDTPGAYPGLAAEERGIGEAIARNLRELSVLDVPIICVIIGEGGSGGALGIGIGDHIVMLENSVYSVISPEGCASILLRDSKRSQEAAALLRMTSYDLKSFGIIDSIIPEPMGGAHADPTYMADRLRDEILRVLQNLRTRRPEQLLKERSRRLLNLGVFREDSVPRKSNIFSRFFKAD